MEDTAQHSKTEPPQVLPAEHQWMTERRRSRSWEKWAKGIVYNRGENSVQVRREADVEKGKSRDHPPISLTDSRTNKIPSPIYLLRAPAAPKYSQHLLEFQWITGAYWVPFPEKPEKYSGRSRVHRVPGFGYATSERQSQPTLWKLEDALRRKRPRVR